jgi:hypothetical protein
MVLQEHFALDWPEVCIVQEVPQQEDRSGVCLKSKAPAIPI